MLGGIFKRGGQKVIECGAVEEIGQRIVVREILNPGLRLPSFGDVLMRGNPTAAGHRPVHDMDGPAVGQLHELDGLGSFRDALENIATILFGVS